MNRSGSQVDVLHLVFGRFFLGGLNRFHDDLVLRLLDLTINVLGGLTGRGIEDVRLEFPTVTERLQDDVSVRRAADLERSELQLLAAGQAERTVLGDDRVGPRLDVGDLDQAFRLVDDLRRLNRYGQRSHARHVITAEYVEPVPTCLLRLPLGLGALATTFWHRNSGWTIRSARWLTVWISVGFRVSQVIGLAVERDTVTRKPLAIRQVGFRVEREPRCSGVEATFVVPLAVAVVVAIAVVLSMDSTVLATCVGISMMTVGVMMMWTAANEAESQDHQDTANCML
jgi:hypothetical protein